VERKRRESLFSVHDRPVITRACLHEGQWRGIRHGRRVQFVFDKSAAQGEQILWRVFIAPRKTRDGNAATVFEAMEYVECEAQRAPLTLREAKQLADSYEENDGTKAK
jgi:hypothetical protein